MAILAQCPICHKKQSVTHKVCIGKIRGDIPCNAALDKLKRSKKVKYWISYRVPGGKQRLEFVGYSIKEARDAEGKGINFITVPLKGNWKPRQSENDRYSEIVNRPVNFRGIESGYNKTLAACRA